MTGWDATIAAYLAVVVLAGVVELVGRRPGTATPTFGELVSAIAITLPGRIALFACWWWVGWHFLARSSARVAPHLVDLP
ncbi:DUF6186 family protein [Pseudonocardia sp. NPDC049154]|jgi:hypothetical protein|uniref:DUF6186 family protein n=1 Tax=Pseudonocardia sp. NPDC049154 TaxID=3155501 RepID=UPI0033E999DB